jgi:hypothetical protein
LRGNARWGGRTLMALDDRMTELTDHFGLTWPGIAASAPRT